MYPYINLELTGSNIKAKIEAAGYTVKNIQEYLHLSCPQPIYRWFSGKILPSVDHLYALSQLLGVHMEEMIVSRPCVFISFRCRDERSMFDMLRYMRQKAMAA